MVILAMHKVELGAGLAWPSVGLVPWLWMAMVRLDWLGRATVYARRRPYIVDRYLRLCHSSSSKILCSTVSDDKDKLLSDKEHSTDV